MNDYKVNIRIKEKTVKLLVLIHFPTKKELMQSCQFLKDTDTQL